MSKKLGLDENSYIMHSTVFWKKNYWMQIWNHGKCVFRFSSLVVEYLFQCRLYCSHRWRGAYFCCTLKYKQMSAEPSCTGSFCWFVIKIFIYVFSLQMNWVSIRTDTSHWPMKWIPPSQNWLVINHIHCMKQQVNWTRILIRVTSQYGSFVDFSYSRDSASKSHVYLP